MNFSSIKKKMMIFFSHESTAPIRKVFENKKCQNRSGGGGSRVSFSIQLAQIERSWRTSQSSKSRDTAAALGSGKQAGHPRHPRWPKLRL